MLALEREPRPLVHNECLGQWSFIFWYSPKIHLRNLSTEKKITMTKVKMNNEGKIKPSNLPYCSSICVFLATHHLSHPLLTGILPVFRYTTLLSVAVVSVGHPGLCGQRKAFCRRRHCESIHFSPLPLEMAVMKEYNQEHLPPDGGGDEGNGAQLSSLPFCFSRPTPEASAVRILFWLS